MAFPLLLTVSNLYHQTRINEEELSQLLLQDKITAQGTSSAENKVFIKWLQRYSLWPWAKHLISANQQVFFLQNSNSSSYLLQIQSSGCQVLFSSLSLCSGFYNSCEDPWDSFSHSKGTVKLQLNVTWEVFRSSPAGGGAGVTRSTWAQWLAALRSPAMGGYSQPGENWAQRVRAELKPAEVGEADQAG